MCSTLARQTWLRSRVLDPGFQVKELLRNWEKKRTIDHCLSPLRYELITFGSADCALSKLVRKL